MTNLTETLHDIPVPDVNTLRSAALMPRRLIFLTLSKNISANCLPASTMSWRAANFMTV